LEENMTRPTTQLGLKDPHGAAAGIFPDHGGAAVVSIAMEAVIAYVAMEAVITKIHWSHLSGKSRREIGSTNAGN